MEVQSKLDDASHWLNTKGAHYEAKAAELKQVRASTFGRSEERSSFLSSCERAFASRARLT